MPERPQSKPKPTLDVRTRREWRTWLAEHHDSEAEVWLVFHKRHTGVESLPYEDAVEEALCFGWIDSILRRLDDDTYVRKFTPRRADSRWSTPNRRRYAKMKALGLLAAAGSRRAPTSRSGDAPRPSASAIPGYIEERLKAVPRAWRTFEALAPSYRRTYVAWIEAARRAETRTRRLEEAVALLAAGKNLGMK
jgi:uncharacterized protein YdeI (YjbR/CyaY-like superfamily)